METKPTQTLFSLQRINELPILERLQLRDLFISNLLSENDEDLQPLTSKQQAILEGEIAVWREKCWQIIEMATDEQVLECLPWLNKQTLSETRAIIAKARAEEDNEY
jgi:hypothetical protein